VVGQARIEDLDYATDEQLALLGIFFANGMPLCQGKFEWTFIFSV
jgi:hypothetical protein